MTQVKFLVNESDMENPHLFAYFPRLKASALDQFFRTSYSHIGQHSACHPMYAKESRMATFEEYKDLKKELESIGYKLKVLNKDNK